MKADEMRRPTPVQPVTRLWFLFNMVLVFIAGVQLFVLSTRTGDYFAWAIGAPISAAYLGAGYWASLIYLILAFRTREWQRARALWIMILTLGVVTLFVTLRDLGAFHIGRGPWTAQLAAWAWLTVYVSIPVISLAIILLQERRGGAAEYAVRFPLLAWVRGLFLILAIVYTVLGFGLLVAPSVFNSVWPWPVPRLPAGAIGAWLLTAAAAAWWTLREGDWYRVRFTVLTYIAFYVLQILAAVRFSSFFSLADWRTWAYIGFTILSPILLVFATIAQDRTAQGGSLGAMPAPGSRPAASTDSV
jgi:hypothetical protein